MAEASSPSSSSSTAAAAAAVQSEEERAEVLDRMLTRLALADDDKVEPTLAKILPYSIASLSSPSPSIRNMVMEILTHINKRVKHRLEIMLPFLELWKIYNESGSSPMDKANMAPDLLVNIANIPPQHQGIILRIVAKRNFNNQSTVDADKDCKFTKSDIKASSSKKFFWLQAASTSRAVTTMLPSFPDPLDAVCCCFSSSSSNMPSLDNFECT